MDENPYETPASDPSGSREKTHRSHPMLAPFWNRVQWAILLLPFIIGIVSALILAISG